MQSADDESRMAMRGLEGTSSAALGLANGCQFYDKLAGVRALNDCTRAVPGMQTGSYHS
ncbi:hypothetical protein SAMN04487926_110104 [Paraburkholderia steynii]|uniref:Uncharacterized protein n=1 Tax=Paraburkholderia steynii TaxID=1245441 RepID=A0A7Z7FIZ8_9BURK|nr:hypothetical protein SAMN04487926_110104 [Paraburkholderia steynii]